MKLQNPNRILHVDGDSFFASCEIALNPKLQGRPVWVGGGRHGDGIVIAANRAAKNFGIKTGNRAMNSGEFGTLTTVSEHIYGGPRLIQMSLRAEF